MEDIGFAELGPQNLRTVLRRDGYPMVGVVLVPRSGANYIAIVNEFNKRVAEIEREMPADIKLGLGFDSSKYIRESIAEVAQTVAVAFVLVFLVIYLFLRDLRTTIIPMVAVPISLIGSFFIMYLMDFSINVLTLLGIVLAIGLVVDDAIVMLENIYAKIERGMEPMAAGNRGSAEVYFAVIATTVALVAVFLPVIFLQGLTGQLFKEFGIVLSGSVIISSFVALTLTPMMATRLLRPKQKHSRFYQRTESFFRNLSEGYRSWLSLMMNHRSWGFVVVGVAVVAIVGFGLLLPTELAPLEDRSGMRMIVTGPEGATYEFMDGYIIQMVDQVMSGGTGARSPAVGDIAGFRFSERQQRLSVSLF